MMLPATEIEVPVYRVALMLPPAAISVVLILPATMLPAAEIDPAVRKLPPCILDVTLRLVRVPILVMLVWTAVNKDPEIPVTDMLPAVMLPAAEINPAVTKLPACTLLTALTVPNTVNKFGPVVSNVNPATASALPLVLNTTCVLDPGMVKFPVILPKKLPTKY